jgi:RNA polymerase sigma-70 factor (ECF subfamily)
LIARAQAGDPAAERALYDAHVGRVYRLAFRMAGDEALAQDFTQDTWVRVFDRLSTFRGEAAFSTWLHSIATNVILNGLRKVDRHRKREADLELADRHPAPRPGLDGSERLRLHAAIDQLSDPLRLVLVMHDLEGFKHPEIAQSLDIPVGTSKARLSRARQKLRVELGLAPASASEERA